MKITFIGTSHGVPEPHRKCSCIMLETQGKLYFIDMGTCAMEKLHNVWIHPNKTAGIFITHMHTDHICGLMSFLDLMTWYYTDGNPVICLPNTDTAKVYADWSRLVGHEPKPFKFTQTKPGLCYEDDTLRLTAYPTQHCPHSFAYVVEAEGKTVLFTGDLKNPAVDFPVEALNAPLDLMICEASHFSARDYLPVIEGKKIGMVCFTHYTDDHFQSMVEVKAILRSKGIAAKHANDDMELVL